MPASGQTKRLRRLFARAHHNLTEDRFRDFGVRIYVVEQDPEGLEALPGRPRVATVGGVHDVGGVWDCRAMRWHSESICPMVWYLSPDQWAVVQHGDDMPMKVLAMGAEGAGKTRGVAAPWVLMRAIEFAGQHVEIGCTAPTGRRLERFVECLRETMAPDWFRWRQHERLFILPIGVTLRCASTTKHSEAVGSPIQGWDWAACASDELQDSGMSVNDDIEARGRRAPRGVYKRVATATAKGTYDWHVFRDQLLNTSLWGVRRMSGFTNPFVAHQHWENLRESLSPREYDRRVLALDVRSERALYTSFERKENIRPVPRVGARDVTAEVLASQGSNRVLLIGHDPGQIQDVSVLLKAYAMPGDPQHAWFVVDEFITPRTTTEEHVAALREHLRARWACNVPDPYRRGVVDPMGPQAHVRIDPWGKSDKRPDQQVYQIFSKYGFDAKSASYHKGLGNGPIPREARIEMVNRLLCAASGRRRLFIAANDRGMEVAPQLARALEQSERDELGRPEQQKKSDKTKDLTDFTTSLSYALWPFERFIRPQEKAA